MGTDTPELVDLMYQLQLDNMIMLMFVVMLLVFGAFFFVRSYSSSQRTSRALKSIEFDTRKIGEFTRGYTMKTPKTISGRWATRNAPKKRAREIFDGSKYIESPISNEEVIDDGEMHQCPKCEVSIMIHWEKCYHCGYRIQS